MPKWMRELLPYFLFLLIVSSVLLTIYFLGVRNERASQKAIENERLVSYGEQIIKLQSDRIVQLKENQEWMRNIDKFYMEKFNVLETQKNNALRDVKSGAIKLSIATKTIPACSGGVYPATAIASGLGENRAELSDAASEFLIDFAHRCDKAALSNNKALDIANHDRLIKRFEAR